MSAKQTEKTSPRREVAVRVKTRTPGARRTLCGVIFSGEWRHLRLDDRGSAYRAIAADPALVMEPEPASAPAAPDDAPPRGKR